MRPLSFYGLVRTASVRAITPASTFSRIVVRSCDLLRCHDRPTRLHRHAVDAEELFPSDVAVMTATLLATPFAVQLLETVATALFDLERAGHSRP